VSGADLFASAQLVVDIVFSVEEMVVFSVWLR